MDLARYALLVLGCTYIVSQSTIGSSLRQAVAQIHAILATLIYCPACTGFWVGVVFYQAWPFAGPMQMVESGLAACAIGAMWGAWGVDSGAVWELEQEGGGDDGEPGAKTSTVERGGEHG
jgi:hypothetical protein